MTGHEHAHGSPAAPTPDAGSSSLRLTVTLALFGSLAGAVLAFTYQKTLLPIRKFAAERVDVGRHRRIEIIDFVRGHAHPPVAPDVARPHARPACARPEAGRRRC